MIIKTIKSLFRKIFPPKNGVYYNKYDRGYTTYKNGLKHGKELTIQGGYCNKNYKDGVLDGEYFSHSSYYDKVKRCYYKNGKLDGYYFEENKNNIYHESGYYDNDIRIGVWYCINGEKAYIKDYSNNGFLTEINVSQMYDFYSIYEIKKIRLEIVSYYFYL